MRKYQKKFLATAEVYKDYWTHDFFVVEASTCQAAINKARKVAKKYGYFPHLAHGLITVFKAKAEEIHTSVDLCEEIKNGKVGEYERVWTPLRGIATTHVVTEEF